MRSQDAPNPGKTSRAFPDYLFTHGDPSWNLASLGEFSRLWPQCKGRSYALLGVRCYTAIREGPDAPRPSGDKPLAACASFRAKWELEPLVAHRVVNRGDLAFPMYPSRSHLELGFFRVVGPRRPQ
jgi:hypothetical protein